MDLLSINVLMQALGSIAEPLQIIAAALQEQVATQEKLTRRLEDLVMTLEAEHKPQEKEQEGNSSAA